MSVDWGTIWAAISAIVAAVIGTVAIIFAWHQLKLTQQQQIFDSWLKAQELWNNKDFRLKRKNIFARLDHPERRGQWTDTEREEALDVCREMDMFAGLIPFLPERMALNVWGGVFAKAWIILEEIVSAERKQTRQADKWIALEKLGKSALKEHPEVKKNP